MKTPQIGLGCANFLKASIPELIEIAARHGFPSISIRPYAFAQALRDGHTEKALRRQLSDAGLTTTIVDGFTGVFPGVPPLTDAERASMPPDVANPPDEETCFRAAEALGVSVLNVIHYRGPELPVAQMAEPLSAVCRRAKTRGLRIALEFVPGTGLKSLTFAQSVIAACGEPNCGIILDFFHLDRSGGTAEDIKRLPPGLIANIQVSDRTRTPPGTTHVPFGGRKLPGDGELPLRDYMAAAMANSPDASVDIEVLNDELRALPVDQAAARLAKAGKAWRDAL